MISFDFALLICVSLIKLDQLVMEKNQILLLKQLIKGASSKAQSALINITINKEVMKKDSVLSMKFCLTQNLAKKNNATSDQILKKKENPFLNPDPALLISELGTTHNLLFNKFNIFKNHLLVVTKEFQSQQNPLSLQDLSQSALALMALNGVLFFNGGKTSGASQPHKHLQLLPESARDLPIFGQIHRFAHKKRQDSNITKQKKILRFPHFTFNHGIIVLQKNQNFQQLGKRLYQAYFKLYEFLEITNKATNQKKDYNLIACQDFLAIFVRKQQNAFGKLSVNSVGFLGSVLFKDIETFEEYLSNENITPLSILQEITLSQFSDKKEHEN